MQKRHNKYTKKAPKEISKRQKCKKVCKKGRSVVVWSILPVQRVHNNIPVITFYKLRKKWKQIGVPLLICLISATQKSSRFLVPKSQHHYANNYILTFYIRRRFFFKKNENFFAEKFFFEFFFKFHFTHETRRV